MQGAYTPITTGKRIHYVDGKAVGLLIGIFDPMKVDLPDFPRNEP